jgi:hypothetical protein
MNPDANYAEQRRLYGSTDPANIERRAELVKDLREWIRHGGFRPVGYKGPAWEPDRHGLSKDQVDTLLASPRAKSLSEWTVLSPESESNVNDYLKALQALGSKVDRTLEDRVAARWFVLTGPEVTEATSRAKSLGLLQGPRGVVEDDEPRYGGSAATETPPEHNRPGKFENSGNIGERLHQLTLDGTLDDECGDVNGPGDHWYGLILESGIPEAEYAVVSESNSGSFAYTAFATPELARAEFDRICAEVVEEENDIGATIGDDTDDVEFDRNMNEMLDAYIDAALVLSSDDGGEPLELNYDRSNIDRETLSEMMRDVSSFLVDHATQIGTKYREAGRDFWFTRNRHGAGFLDSGWPKTDEKALTDSARAYGETSLYVGDDGKIHSSQLARIEDQNDRRDRIQMAAEQANRKRT